jgi:hypothetical protein
MGSRSGPAIFSATRWFSDLARQGTAAFRLMREWIIIA